MKKSFSITILAVFTAVLAGCTTSGIEGPNQEAAEPSPIESLTYNQETQNLTITFENSQAFTFLNVPADAYIAFKTAESKADHFNTRINGVYRYKTAE